MNCNPSKITEELIKEISSDKNNIVLSKHANIQCLLRVIDSEDIWKVLQFGEIIENYPNDYPYPSCLMLAFLQMNKPMHVCCAVIERKINIITAYYPDNARWEEDMKTRKAAEK